MRIGELAERTGVSTKTLRFYEAEGLLHEPDRTPSGYRDYAKDAIGRVEFIRRAQSAGLRLGQIQQVFELDERGESTCAHVRAAVEARLADIDERLADLQRTRRELVAIQKRLDNLEPADCGDYCHAIR